MSVPHLVMKIVVKIAIVLKNENYTANCKQSMPP